MREEIVPGDLVFIEQFIDRTKGVRDHTFFGDGCVGHVGFGDPICKSILPLLAECAAANDILHHVGGTYVCIEGPQFSTRAESRLYRSWDVSVVGMTNLTEAKLAREAELHYATIAMATDYDVWHEGEEDVSVEQVLTTLRNNVDKATRLIRAVVPRLHAMKETRECACDSALEFAVMTAQSRIPAATRERLQLLMKRYWDGQEYE
jgi:5'-methylthioadenosine phosphorylase